MRSLTFLAAVLLTGTLVDIVLTAPAHAAGVPALINHQGRVEVNGTPFNGTGAFRFAIIVSPGDVNMWTNDGTQTGTTRMPDRAQALSVTNGYYSVNLGGSNPIPSDLFRNDADLRLRIWFDDGRHGAQLLQPDQQLTSAGYAMYAKTAESVMDNSVTSAQIVEGSVEDSDLADGAALAEILDDDGSGSGLDADTLDGQDSSEFAADGHSHDLAALSGTVASGQLPADLEANSLTVGNVYYDPVHTLTYSLGPGDFVPDKVDPDTEYRLDELGAYFITPPAAAWGALIAPVHLPSGSNISAMTAYFYDDSTLDLDVTLRRKYHGAASAPVASVDSSGVSGTGSSTTEGINSSIADGYCYSVRVSASSLTWDGDNLKIRAVSIEYTLDSTP